jgi:4-amino-4-deoxy-L-arabinose transferase-like glycosyltransferase
LKIQIKDILWAYAFLLVGLAYFFGLFVDLTGDSGLYAAISRQMVESGDWFNLKIHGKPYDQKPHLFFWLAGIGIQLFGNTNFAFKLFPALYGWLGFYFTFKLGEALFTKKTGMLAALIVGTSQIFFLYFFDFHTDTILQTGTVLALWQLAKYLKNRKTINFILGFFGIGLAMISKGPIGAVLPFFAVLLYLIAKKDFRQLFNPKWILGILIVLVVILPELFYLYKNFGWEGIKFFFITNNLGRITGEFAGSSSNPFFYIETILWAFLPWTILALISFFKEIKSWFVSSNKNLGGIYLLGSVLVLFLILSVAKGKAPNYFLIAIPVVSVVVANWLAGIPQMSIKTQRKVYISQNIYVALSGVFTLVIFIVYPENKLFLIVFLISLLSVFLFFKYQKELLMRMLFTAVLVSGTLNLFLNIAVIPKLFAFQGARQALEIYELQRKENDVLLNLQLVEYELFYYANSNVQEFTNWEDFYDLFEKAGTWVYTDKIGYEGILKLNHPLASVYKIRQQGMNELTIKFLNPGTRQDNLKENYLIKVHSDNF